MFVSSDGYFRLTYFVFLYSANICLSFFIGQNLHSTRQYLIQLHSEDVKYVFKRSGIVEKRNFYILKENLKLTRNLEVPYSANSAGRNYTGHITVRHRGGGTKENLKLIDKWFLNYGQEASSAIIVDVKPRKWQAYPLGLIMYINNDGFYEYRYVVLNSTDLKVGDIIRYGASATIKTGNSLPIKYLPVNTQVNNMEMYPGKGAQVGVSSRQSVTIMHRKDEKRITVKLPSGKNKDIHQDCYATIAGKREFVTGLKMKKAGDSRKRGRRPTVRGVAMNPIDHPHGGGTGKASVGRKNALTPWGKYFRGKKHL